MKTKSYAVVFSMMSALLVSCGGSSGGEGAAQPGSSIIINPASVSLDVAASNGTATNRQPFVITVNNSSGNPLRDTKVQLFLDFAPGSSTNTAMSLLDSSGVAHTSPFEATTDSNGTILVYVDYLVGRVPTTTVNFTYKGFLQAFSGGAFQNAFVEVTCVDADPAVAPNC